MSFTEKELSEYHRLAHPKSPSSIHRFHQDLIQEMVNQKNSYGADFLYFLVKNDNTPLYNNLIYHGVKFNYQTITQAGETLLHMVKDIRMLEILMQTDAKDYIYKKDKNENTVLHRYINNMDLIKKIRPHFFNYNDFDKQQKPLLKGFNLQKLSDVNNFLNIYSLFNKKLNIEFEYKKNTPFLFALIYLANQEQLKKIEDTHVDFTMLSQEGNNIVHYLIETGKYEKIDYLKSISKEHFNQKNNHGDTPLTIALKIENGTAINFLVKKGIKPSLDEINLWLKTPILTAMEAFASWMYDENNLKTLKNNELLSHAKSYIGRVAKEDKLHALLEKLILEENMDSGIKPVKKMKI